MEIGERLAFLRASAGLTQAELGERVGLNTQTVNRIEKGASSPTVKTLQSLVEACGSTLNAFFQEDDGEKEELVWKFRAILEQDQETANVIRWALGHSPVKVGTPSKNPGPGSSISRLGALK